MTEDVPGGANRRTLMTGSLAALALGATTGGVGLYRTRHEVPATYGLTVAMRSEHGPWRGTRQLVDREHLEQVLPGSRVLAGPEQEPLLEAQEEWLSGLTLPGSAGALSDLARAAALDLWVLSAGLPLAVAGWSPMWRHAWPRDTAHVAVALHRLGDTKGATRQLASLAELVGRELHLVPRSVRIQRAQAMVRSAIPKGANLVDELIAERRAEADRDSAR